jgi:Na+-translocating ferredoxin:NAD+ oxidoreductase RnfC subunit
MENLSRDEIIKRVKAAGVVGAGGAGFPTHKKIDCTAETLIINIAECEPLICKDKEIARLFPQSIVRGAHLAMQAIGAKKAHFALKEKYADIASNLKSALMSDMSIVLLEDYYPAGDEVLLAYEVTGAIIPEGNIPLSKGIVVLNAETLYNISHAIDQEPVIEKFLTITGAIQKPVTLKAPVGMMLKDILALLRIPPDDLIPIVDGTMMGTITEDLTTPIAKTTSGIVLLPKDHPVISKRKRSGAQDRRIIKSACDQCSYCTEYCPRYLIGHRVEPHRIMRTLSFSNENDMPDYASGCVACSLCTLFACPESLSPDVIMKEAKRMTPAKKKLQSRSVHPMREFRKVPSSRLLKRISLDGFDRPAPFMQCELKPRTVKIPLIQYGGESLQTKKSEDDQVARGEQLAAPAQGTLAASVHASIGGIITAVEQHTITIERAP